MSVRKGGRTPVPPEHKRIKISPALPPEVVDTMRVLAAVTGLSQADVLCKLIVREAKRLKVKL